MISGTVRFGSGGVHRNVGNADGGTGFLEHRGSAFNNIIDTNTAKLNALMEAMNGKAPPTSDAPSALGDGDGGGDGGGDTGDDAIQGNDQYIMAMWSAVNGQLNLAISLQGKDCQSAYETSKGLIQNMAG